MEVDWGLIITKILTILIEMLLPVVLYAGVKWLNQHAKEVAARIDKQQLETARFIIQRLVLAAEQNGLVDGLKKVGAEKKAYVLTMAEQALAARGINMDLDTLDALIEAEVIEAFGMIQIDLPLLEDAVSKAPPDPNKPDEPTDAVSQMGFVH